MTKLYNIKNNDMLYFLLFSVVLIPFQFIADVFTLSVLNYSTVEDLRLLIYTRTPSAGDSVEGLGRQSDECIRESSRSTRVF